MRLPFPLMPTSPSFQVRISGDLAVFSRPELKAERMSYPIPTPSALRGAIEAIFWKPAIRWQVTQIQILNPIRFKTFLRNEVNKKAPAPSAATVDDGGEAPQLLAEDERAQRNTVALRDVDYLVTVKFELTKRAGPEENVKKFEEIFLRRLGKGQHFHQPYLGCRECIADVRPSDPSEPGEPISESTDFGLVLWDIDFSGKKNRPVFFHALMENGSIQIPASIEEAKASVLQFATNQGGGAHV